MTNEYIRKQDAIELCNNPLSEQSMQLVPPADVIPYSFASDGTLIVTVPNGTYKKVNRVLVEEDGTHWGGLFYKD